MTALTEKTTELTLLSFFTVISDTPLKILLPLLSIKNKYKVLEKLKNCTPILYT